MEMGYMKFKRVIHRMGEEIRSTMDIVRVLGIKAGWLTFRGKVDMQLIVHNGRIERPRYRQHLKKKHEIMNLYFEKTCPLTDRCRDAEVSVQNEKYRDCIWVCWWQGLDNAPEIVKKCIDSIKRNAGKHQVIVITDENVKQFVHFPLWIEEKYKKGIITKTHISDILRLKLLAEYGGIWLDSTFYCNGSLEEYFSVPIWSIKRPEYRYTSVAAGYFANYSFACNTENRKVFAILAEYLLEYWQTHDYMVDYLFLDYLIVQAQKQDDQVKKVFQSIKSNNPECDELLKILGSKYDENTWKKLKKETKLFKLTWKAHFPVEIQGQETFYGRLLKGLL